MNHLSQYLGYIAVQSLAPEMCIQLIAHYIQNFIVNYIIDKSIINITSVLVNLYIFRIYYNLMTSPSN